MMSLVEDLKAAKALIDTPDKFILSGWPEHEGEKRSVANALIETAGHGILDCVNALEAEMPRTFAIRHAVFRPLGQFCDSALTTHADIMALFDRAIARATEQEAK